MSRYGFQLPAARRARHEARDARAQRCTRSTRRRGAMRPAACTSRPRTLATRTTSSVAPAYARDENPTPATPSATLRGSRRSRAGAAGASCSRRMAAAIAVGPRAVQARRSRDRPARRLLRAARAGSLVLREVGRRARISSTPRTSARSRPGRSARGVTRLVVIAERRRTPRPGRITDSVGGKRPRPRGPGASGRRSTRPPRRRCTRAARARRDLVMHSATKSFAVTPTSSPVRSSPRSSTDAWAQIAQLRHDEGAGLGPSTRTCSCAGCGPCSACRALDPHRVLARERLLELPGVTVRYPAVDAPAAQRSPRARCARYGGMLSIQSVRRHRARRGPRLRGGSPRRRSAASESSS